MHTITAISEVAMKPHSDSIVVLLHSSASTAHQWNALAQALKMHFEVHAIDLLGHGERAAWAGPAPMALADEAAPVDALIARRRGRLHLVGHSYGGALALDIARRHPRAVASVVVYEPVLLRALHTDAAGTPELEGFRAAAARVQAAVAAQRVDDAAACFVDFWSGAGSWAHLSASRQAAVASRMASVAHQFDALYAADDPRAALAAQALPTLVLTGACTVPATRCIGELLEAAWPHAAHRRLPALGHMGPLTHAHDVNPVITDFLLRQVDPARPRAALSETTPA
ncbi:alpha/beta fold hydrolase [Piscinibacter sp.]|uniref:alpha/beta fold hydrolase n=1 Tax=Piscinibacter sp. TaxID=1903157 RepID=UPI002B824ED3|nr:alpha/beta hydrolase [Albitalea sp.]HUG24465.1 alpha/beta hydrolase [Albitalea sp.]